MRSTPTESVKTARRGILKREKKWHRQRFEQALFPLMIKIKDIDTIKLGYFPEDIRDLATKSNIQQNSNH